jgi:hypothetical protein
MTDGMELERLFFKTCRPLLSDFREWNTTAVLLLFHCRLTMFALPTIWLLWWIFAQLLWLVAGNMSLVPGNASLLWGPYEPGVYFGFRPRISPSIRVGLMWFDANTSHVAES